MKKIFSLIFLFFSLFSTCYSEEEPKKLIVLLDWFMNPNHAPLFIAEEKGFFKAHKLDVKLIGPADPADPPKLVAAGKADIAITYQPQFLEQVDHQLPLIRIGTLINRPLTCLTVLKESSIQHISDLKNKTIGYSNGDVNSISLKTMLEKNNLTLKDVKNVNVHYNLTQPLLAKRVDAVSGMMRNIELIELELAGHPGRAFFPEEQGVPTYSELIFVVNTKHKNDPKFSAFLSALAKGIEYLRAHPQEAWQLFAKKHPELNNELNRRSWFSTIDYFVKNPAYLDKKSWIAFANFMKKNGLIKQVKKISDYSVEQNPH